MTGQVKLYGGPMDMQYVPAENVDAPVGRTFTVQWFDPVATPGLSPKQSVEGMWTLTYLRTSETEAEFQRKFRTP
jgi:hypothetical protein